jgi:hypothetical protein
VKRRRPVLAVLEALEAVEDQRLREPAPGTPLLVEEPAVAPESRRLGQHGGGRDLELTRDLSVGGATQQAMEYRTQEIRAFEPVGGQEGLITEETAAV